MGLQAPPYAVLSPLVTDPPDPPGDPESSLFLTCHFVLKGPCTYAYGLYGSYCVTESCDDDAVVPRVMILDYP